MKKLFVMLAVLGLGLASIGCNNEPEAEPVAPVAPEADVDVEPAPTADVE